MKLGFIVALSGALLMTGAAVAEEKFKLPPEVTPKLRAACEGDVRRLCVGNKPTVSRVKRCVARKFLQLGRRCQFELAAVGFRH